MSKDPASPDGTRAGIPPEAFYLPDQPIRVVEGEIPEDAIFSPDDPIIRQEEGVVTGISGEAEHGLPSRGELAWEIRHAANIMEGLSRALREQGMEALRVHPETEPMDAMLRSFVAGYLVGRLDIRD